VAAALFVLLVATSGGYGWHRDELYFLVAGRHPSWGYPDQPLFTPLVVAAEAAVGNGSLTVVRLASALGSAATAVLTGLLAAEMGGGARARLVAAATWAVGGVSLVTGHFVDTTTFDVLAATGVCWCLARAMRTNAPSGWPVWSALLDPMQESPTGPSLSRMGCICRS
jgi:Dolichyl-phosphate-mannose-protein mannosyltransferase